MYNILIISYLKNLKSKKKEVFVNSRNILFDIYILFCLKIGANSIIYNNVLT